MLFYVFTQIPDSPNDGELQLRRRRIGPAETDYDDFGGGGSGDGAVFAAGGHRHRDGGAEQSFLADFAGHGVPGRVESAVAAAVVPRHPGDGARAQGRLKGTPALLRGRSRPQR